MAAAGAEVGAADADDHKYVGIAADLLRRPLDAGDLFRGLPDGAGSASPRKSLPAPVPSARVVWAAATSFSMASRSDRVT